MVSRLPHLMDNAYGFEEQIASFAFVNALLLASNAQVLTRRAKCDNVHRLNRRAVNQRYVAKLLHLRETRRCYLQRVFFYLRCPHRHNAAHGAGQREAAGAVKQ